MRASIALGATRALASSVLLLAVSGAAVSAAALSYSSDSGRVIQAQPAAHSCRARGSGLFLRPDPRCTPGALNPSVTEATIGSTICRRGWTAQVRPPESVTEPEKFASLEAYGEGPAHLYEYDHLVALELGGAVNDPRNLWPEPDYAHPAPFYLNPKDYLGRALNRLVCHHQMPLSEAQRMIASDWVTAYHRYG